VKVDGIIYSAPATAVLTAHGAFVEEVATGDIPAVGEVPMVTPLRSLIVRVLLALLSVLLLNVTVLLSVTNVDEELGKLKVRAAVNPANEKVILRAAVDVTKVGLLMQNTKLILRV